MIVKLMGTLSDFGRMVGTKYADISNRWVALVLFPVLVVFTVLHVLVIVLLLTICAIQFKLEGFMTFTETFSAFKEGIVEGWHELKG